MISKSLISVTVPICKVEKYLSKSLDSIVNQTYKDIEIIIVDDGSTDSCSEVNKLDYFYSVT
ncbi:glycosyltransferase family 2 protein [Leuconostoc mesenteroides]|uniref:glycosyltransferase family 2 protein n=1 Tax=Leuconostoc mesenteroides TaxID=1245 RepID=UPI00235E39CC|nr:glycosyltransferase family A protein [Leuconostoc mesenteroides]